jgi:serine/threonine protein kinase
MDDKYENIKIIKKLKSGMMGSTFLAKLNKTKLVVKVSKILLENLKKNEPTWKELTFGTSFAKKHKKELLFYTKDYKIIENCNTFEIGGKVFKHPAFEHCNKDNLINIEPNWRKVHEKLSKSKYCLINIIPYLDGSDLQDFISKTILINGKIHSDKFNKKQYYGWFIDILKQIKLLHSNGYTHNDIHPGNIMILKSGKATLIDYGAIDNKQWNSKSDKTHDYTSLYYLTHASNHFNEIKRINKKYGQNKFPIGQKYYLQDLAKFMKTKESKQILGLCKSIPKKHQKHIAFDLADMLMPSFTKKIALAKYAGETNYMELWMIDIEDSLFYLDNIYTHGIGVVIKHLENKYTTL